MQKRMGGTFDGLAQRMVGSISDDDIGKMSTYQRVVAGAIATDKLVALSAAPLRQELVNKLTEVLDLLRQQRDVKEAREYEEDAQRFHEQQRRLQLPAGQSMSQAACLYE